MSLWCVSTIIYYYNDIYPHKDLERRRPTVHCRLTVVLRLGQNSAHHTPLRLQLTANMLVHSVHFLQFHMLKGLISQIIQIIQRLTVRWTPMASTVNPTCSIGKNAADRGPTSANGVVHTAKTGATGARQQIDIGTTVSQLECHSWSVTASVVAKTTDPVSNGSFFGCQMTNEL